MKFKSDIEIQAGVNAGGSTGDSGQILSSTGTDGVAWIDQNAITSSSDFVFFNVKNETGSTILKGKGVMAVGTDGNSGHILIDEMVADGTVESKYFLGVLEEDIPNGGFARVISFGQLSQFNTNGQNGETWADGQVLWCDPANPGDFTITEPDGPNVKIAAAFILNSSTNGKIQVRVQANEGIHDLHDTKITSQVDGDVLVWDNTTGVWFNDSTLNVDYTNGRVGIGTISPDANLEIESSTGGVLRLTSSNTTVLTGESIGKIEFKSNDASTGGNNVMGFINSVATNVGTRYALSFGTGDAAAAVERMRITNEGNVGIGTTDPGAKLDVYTNTSAAYAGRFTQDHALGYGVLIDVDSTSVNQPALWVKNAATTSIWAGSNGKVGIGTTGPSYQLTLGGNAVGSTEGLRINDPSNAAYGAHFSFSDTPNEVWIGGITNNTYNSAIGIHREATRSVTIDVNNNVGIGETSPNAKLDVAGNIIINSALLSNQENTNVDTGAEVVAQVSTSTYTAAFFDFVIKKVGNIRSGTVYACHDGINVEFTETSTNDLGDTSDVTLSVDKSGTNLRLIATVTSDDWIIKSLIRGI